MYLQNEYAQANRIVDYIKNPDMNYFDGVTPNTKHFCYVLSQFGRLFLNDYRVLEILPKKIVLLVPNDYSNLAEKGCILAKIQPRNKFRNEKDYRLRTFSKLAQRIRKLPFKGQHKALILYLDNRSYSLLSLTDLESQMTPNIHHAKHMKFYEDYTQTHRTRPKQIDCKQAGTLFHSLMEFYICGNGWMSNETILRQLNTYQLLYNPPCAIQTVNYIIGLQLIKGAYDVISTQKLLEITTLIGDDYTNFNRLDLVLRNSEKVLVIDWKFSGEKASDYMKGYKHKVQKYLTLVKKYYKCQVQFHLYCIHAKDNGFMCEFTTETIHKRMSNVEILAEEDDDVWVIQSQQMKPSKKGDHLKNTTISYTAMIEQLNGKENMKQCKQGIEYVNFQLLTKQLEDFCTNEVVKKPFDQGKVLVMKENQMIKQIHKEQNQQQVVVFHDQNHYNQQQQLVDIQPSQSINCQVMVVQQQSIMEVIQDKPVVCKTNKKDISVVDPSQIQEITKDHFNCNSSKRNKSKSLKMKNFRPIKQTKFIKQISIKSDMEEFTFGMHQVITAKIPLVIDLEEEVFITID